MPKREHRKCHKCRLDRVYNTVHDAWTCVNCDIWLEPRCDDRACEFCSTRPTKPSEVTYP